MSDHFNQLISIIDNFLFIKFKWTELKEIKKNIKLSRKQIDLTTG